VRSLIRTATIVAGTVIGLLALIVIGLNLYVQSLGTQARIQQELSQRLGAPVRIKAVSVTPWGGLSLSGISIASEAAGGESDFLTAKSFELHAGIVSLFTGSLVIKKVSLVSPKIVWPQNEDGKWRLPGARKSSKSAQVRESSATPESPAASPLAEPSASATAVVAATSPEPAGPAPVESPPVSPPRPKTVTVLVPDVRRAAIDDGDFRFLDRSGALVAAFEGVELRATVQNLNSLRGSATIAKMSARDRFFLERLRSPIRYDQQGLELPKISARAAGGEMSGAFHMEPQSKDSPFKVSVKFREVQADQLVSDAGGSPGMITGKLEGNFDASGSASDTTTLSGTGDIVLHDGQLQQYSILVALGQVLQIEELTQLHLEQAEAKYHITPGLVTIDELILRSPNIRLSATGTVNFNGKLHLNSQLAINEKVRSQLFKPIRQNFQPTADAGYSAVDFQVSGTLDRPKTNLVDRIVGRDLKDLVSGFLGGKKPDKPKKKKQGENATPPSEEAMSPGEETVPEPAGSAASPTPPAP
jgi:type II secretion system protein N